MSQSDLPGVEEIFQEMAKRIYTVIEYSEIEDWKYAILDLRYEEESGTAIHKIRIYDSKESAYLNTGNISKRSDLVPLILDLCDAKETSPTDHWHGVLLTIYPDGSSQVNLNDDPDCFNDPQFFQEFFED
ncbi:Hypothetical protein PBC10988_25010 [Planctomycetales bacterium 10988]|nr:Hypothetical protein PBC10988_25010 [Planctomycetales bacterium 10988]